MKVYSIIRITHLDTPTLKESCACNLPAESSRKEASSNIQYLSENTFKQTRYFFQFSSVVEDNNARLQFISNTTAERAFIMAMLKDRLEDQGKDVFRVNVSTHLSKKKSNGSWQTRRPGKRNEKKKRERKKENEPNTSKSATLEKRKALEGDSCTCCTRVPVDYFQPAR